MTIVILIVLGIILYCIIEEIKEKRKKQLREQKRQEAEHDKKIKLEEEHKKAQERAKKILNEKWFIRLFDEVNKKNIEYKNIAGAVYDCYPFSSFSVHQEYVLGGYHDMKIENGVQLKYEFTYVHYKDLGIDDLDEEEQKIVAVAFGLKEGYVYSGERNVVLDKHYWRATKSVDDILDVYNS